MTDREPRSTGAAAVRREVHAGPQGVAVRAPDFYVWDEDAESAVRWSRDLLGAHPPQGEDRLGQEDCR